MKPRRRLSSPENPVNFLKIILSDDTQSTGIRIPKKFTETHANDLVEKVILKVPNGDVWKVDLKKSNGEIWLKNGWREFAEHYGLKFGNLLMFKYEGFSIFGVIIFSANASEIDYPKNNNHIRNSVKSEERKDPVSCGVLKTVKKEDDTCSSWSEDTKHGIKINDEGECSRKMKTQRRDDGRRALKKAKANFRCDKPFFMVHMNQSYVASKRGVYIPNMFRPKLLRHHQTHRKCLLQFENDRRQRTWEVVARNEYLGDADWLMFVQDNGIKVGDICVFKQIHKHLNVLNVTVFKSTC